MFGTIQNIMKMLFCPLTLKKPNCFYINCVYLSPLKDGTRIVRKNKETLTGKGRLLENKISFYFEDVSIVTLTYEAMF